MLAPAPLPVTHEYWLHRSKNCLKITIWDTVSIIHCVIHCKPRRSDRRTVDLQGLPSLRTNATIKQIAVVVKTDFKHRLTLQCLDQGRTANAVVGVQQKRSIEIICRRYRVKC